MGRRCDYNMKDVNSLTNLKGIINFKCINFLFYNSKDHRLQKQIRKYKPREKEMSVGP
jgi:hypothetical protein